jgi:pimeloyl-ACP methyl ester carboxylesterase
MTAIAVIREGEGPEILLIHGGASPATTWRGLDAMRDHWTLAFVHRRGYPPSPPPPGGRQDIDIDALDLAPLLDRRPHVVAHSYGALGALIAAANRPDRIRSLTLIEPAVFLVTGNPDVARFMEMGDAVLTHGLETDPDVLRAFLRVAGAPVNDGPLSEDVTRAVRRAHGSRLPGEADLSLGSLRDAGIPCLVASGGHAEAIERMCDAVARELKAERVVVAGGGHFVAGAHGFSEKLQRFLIAAE